MAASFATVDDYVNSYPPEVQSILNEIRRTIAAAVPSYGERISYQMPTATTDGHDLVYFAAWKRHIGMYPVPEGDEAFERELAPYRAATSTVRFPYAAPIPYQLIGAMVELLLRQRD